MLLYYIRHGFPTYNPDCLTPLGKRQAEAVGKRLAMHGIDRIFSSTSQRAIETAEPLSEMVRKEIELLDFANEKHAGADFFVTDKDGNRNWVGNLPFFREICSRPDFKKLGMDWYTHPAFKDYTFESGIKRVQDEADKFLEGLGYKHIREEGRYEIINPNDQKIALFAHAGFGQAFMSAILDVPYPEFAIKFGMRHSGVTVINFVEKRGMCIPFVLTYSEGAHLYMENLPTEYDDSGMRI